MITTTLPMFPLELVAYPGEKLALHIFEDRYQQLVRDCEEEDIRFGIPAYIDNTMEYGTEMKLNKVVKKYPSGASDIICEGLKVFKLTGFYNTLSNKLYAGGDVSFIEQDFIVPSSLYKNTFIELLREFYDALDVKTPIINKDIINSYALAHKMGLTLEQEYGLLQITSEDKRYQYLTKHLKIILPALNSVNRTKELIKMNGHFKNFDPLDFKDYKDR